MKLILRTVYVDTVVKKINRKATITVVVDRA